MLSLQLLGQPEVFIGGGGQKFTEGELTDAATRDFLAKMLATFITFATRVKIG